MRPEASGQQGGAGARLLPRLCPSARQAPAGAPPATVPGRQEREDSAHAALGPRAGFLRVKTAGKLAPCWSLCPGLRDCKAALRRRTVSGPRSVGLQGFEHLQGTTGPCGGPTSWPSGVPVSHGHDPQGQAPQAQPQPLLLPWDGDREPGSPEATVVRLEKRSCLQGPQCCPEARGNRRSPHRPQKLRDTFRATKRVIGKSCLSPSQDRGWAHPPWAQREHLPGTKGTLGCHLSLAPAQPGATGHGH